MLENDKDTAPERIWAWVWNIPYSKHMGDRAWTPYKPYWRKPIERFVSTSKWNPFKGHVELIEQKATEYVRADLLPNIPEVKNLIEAAEKLLHSVCGETGFAAAVRTDSGYEYPWPALDNAERALKTSLSVLKGLN